MSYLLYCICATPEKAPYPLPAGVDGQPVRLIENGSLSAVVSVLSARIESLPRDARSVLVYEKVIETFHREGAVLPLRYGSLLEEECQVIEHLRQHRQAYLTTLHELDGCVEMGIRVILEHGKGHTPDAREPCEVSPCATGAEYLAARKDYFAECDRLRGRGTLVPAQLQEVFAGLFVRCRLESLPPPGSFFRVPVLSLDFLVKREYEEAFRQTFRTLSQAHSLKMLLSGPWPPHSFASLEKGEEPHATECGGE